MLRLVLKKDEQLKIGEDITIKSMNDGRVNLAIDAPKELKIERLKPENKSIALSESRNTSCDIFE